MDNILIVGERTNVKQTNTDPQESPLEQWDCMLSYRHAKHKHLASTLARFLGEAGVKCWLDTSVIDQTVRFLSSELKEILRRAAEASRIVVGFPQEDMRELDPRSQTSRTRFSWLFWERQFAEQLLWVEGSWLCAFPEERIPFYNYPHLAYYLGLATGKGKAMRPYWEKYFGCMPPTTRSAYKTDDLHSLPIDLLPPILNPKCPDSRRNAILRSSIQDRNDLSPEHRMQIL